MKPIQEIRKENLLKQTEAHGGIARLAEILEISSSQLSQAIKGDRNFSSESLRKFEIALNLEPNWFDHEHN